MTVGLAFSGGDIVATLGTICSMKWLTGTYPKVSDHQSDVIVSTVSGGSMGYGVMANNGHNITTARYDPNVTVAEVSHPPKLAEGEFWFGASGATRRTESFDWASMNWATWSDVVGLFYTSYGVEPAKLQGGPVPWHVNFGQALKTAIPLKTNSLGVVPDPGVRFQQGHQEMHAAGAGIHDVAYSSAFWSMDAIFDSNMTKFDAVATNLPQDATHYYSDGGTSDVSAITTLLRKQVKSVVAFFNDCEDITKAYWEVSVLFGTEKGRYSHATVDAGGLATQVFPTSLAADVIANLTNPNIMRAHLRNVPVLANEWLGVRPYTLDSLIIFSSMRNKQFLDSFSDQKVVQQLSDKWPTQFHMSIPTLDANLFCMLQEWKMEKYKEEIGAALNAN